MNKLYKEGRIIKSGKTLYQKLIEVKWKIRKKVLRLGGTMLGQLVLELMKLKII